jgi:hypothetical protein
MTDRSSMLRLKIEQPCLFVKLRYITRSVDLSKNGLCLC